MTGLTLYACAALLIKEELGTSFVKVVPGTVWAHTEDEAKDAMRKGVSEQPGAEEYDIVAVEVTTVDVETLLILKML